MCGECEYGKCEICGEEAYLSRTYFYYPIVLNFIEKY